MELDDKGILRYVLSAAERMPSGEPRAVGKIWFDTQKGFRPVYYEAIHNRPDGTWGAQTVRLEWAQYNGTWYVSRAERDELPSHQVRCTFVVESFTPNVEVSDKEFTLEGLGIAHGMRVVDSIAGITYPYGYSVYTPEELEQPLKEAQFVGKIIKSTAASSNGLVDSNQGPAPADGDRRTDRPGEVSVVGQTSANTTWVRWVGLIAAAIVAGAIAFFACRRKIHFRKS